MAESLRIDPTARQAAASAAAGSVSAGGLNGTTPVFNTNNLFDLESASAQLWSTALHDLLAREAHEGDIAVGEMSARGFDVLNAMNGENAMRLAEVNKGLI